MRVGTESRNRLRSKYLEREQVIGALRKGCGTVQESEASREVGGHSSQASGGLVIELEQERWSAVSRGERSGD